MPTPTIESRSSRPAGAAVLAAAVATILTLVAGCTIEDPALPTFSTRLAVPVGTHDLTVAELIEDQDFLYAGADSVLFFSVEGDSTLISLDLNLSADLDGIDTETTIGAVALEDLDPLAYEFALGDIVPGVGGLPPGTYPVPPFDFETESGAEEIAGFEYAQVSSGTITLVIHNDLPIPLSGVAPPELLVAEILHPDTAEILASLVFDGEIAPGSTAEASDDLAGVRLPGSLVVRLRGGSAGSPAAQIDPADAVGVELSIHDLVVDSARAVVGSQSFQETGAVALPDSLHIIEATVASGLMDVTLSSGLPIPATVYIFFEQFETPEGLPFFITFEMPRNGVESTQADLAGAIISAGDGAPLDSLAYTIGVVSPGSGDELVDINSGSHVTAVMSPCTLALGEITGIIPEHRFELEPMTQEIDIPDELDGVRLAAAVLTVEIMNGTNIGGEIELELTGRNAGGESVSLTSTAAIAPSRSEGFTLTTITLNENNSAIADLLSILPESFTFSGTVSVGGEDEVGTVRPGDEAQVNWRADAPLRLIVESSEIDRDPVALGLDEDMRDILDDHLVQAEIIMDIDNHFPFGLDVFFLVGPDSLSAMEDPELEIGPLSVDAGVVGEISHYVEQSRLTRHVIALDTDQIRAFTRPGAYTALRVLIPGTNGEEVLLRTGDGLSAAGAISAEIIVKDD